MGRGWAEVSSLWAEGVGGVCRGGRGWAEVFGLWAEGVHSDLCTQTAHRWVGQPSWLGIWSRVCSVGVGVESVGGGAQSVGGWCIHVGSGCRVVSRGCSDIPVHLQPSTPVCGWVCTELTQPALYRLPTARF